MTTKIPRAASVLEETFWMQCKVLRLPMPVREHRFDPTRMWRADFAFLDCTPPLLVECEGGTATNGRHNRAAGFQSDTEKYNAMTLAGFALLRFTARDIKKGTAIAQVQGFLATRGAFDDLLAPLQREHQQATSPQPRI